MNLILLLLGMFSLCALVSESFSLLLPRQTWFWLALLCMLLWFVSGFRHGILIGMPLCALALYYLYRQDAQDLLLELRDILEHIEAAYYSHFTDSIYSFSSETAISSHMTALLFVFFLIAAFVSTVLTSRSFRIPLALLSTIPIFIICVNINGTPSVIPVLGTFLFYLGVFISGDSFRTDDGAGKAVLLALLPCLMILCALLLIYRPDTYQPDKQASSLAQRFDNLSSSLSSWAEGKESFVQAVKGAAGSESIDRFPPSAWNDGTDNLNLNNPFDASQLTRTAFHLKTDTSGTIYLRGRSYGDYHGTFWSPAVENTHGRALSYTAYAINRLRETNHFELSSSMPYDILYLPYFTESEHVGDVQINAESRTAYAGDFYRYSDSLQRLVDQASLPIDFKTEETQYREYVHNYYTRLPDETRAKMELLCSREGLSPDLGSLFSDVREYVQKQGVYDTAVLPYTDSDYAVCFLTESHHGYCIHYATAACVLFRTLNIPARICEGYMVNTLPHEDIQVTGADAHAWVEVYQDGVGWLPVEVTASAAQGLEAPLNEDSSMPDESSDPAEPAFSPPEEDSSTLPDAESDSASDPESSAVQEDASIQEESAAASSAGSDRETESRLHKALPAVLKGILILAAILGLFYCRYRILRFRLNRRLNSAENGIRTVNCYLYAEKLASVYGSVPPVIKNTAEKARFSQHEITDAELSACMNALTALKDECFSSLSRSKQWLYRYLFGLF